MNGMGIGLPETRGDGYRRALQRSETQVSTPPAVGTAVTFRLVLKSSKTVVGSPFVKMSAYWEPVGTCRTLAERHLVANEVEIYLDVLRALMLDRVGGEVDRRDVVTVDDGGAGRRAMKLDE
jgi:hypothetical protein